MFKKMLKDERGLSLVELLAVVVIMAVIAGIGAVSISNVIQKNREDAAISNVQQMLASANLYDMSNPTVMIPKAGATTDTVNIEKIMTEGFINQINFLEGTDDTTRGEKVFFYKTDDAKALLTIDLKAEAFKAGSKPSKPLELTEAEASKLTRAQLFDTP